jgi:hypothetical protein
MTETTLGALLSLDLIVPIRSSTGQPVSPERVPLTAMRHGTDEKGRFLPAYTTPERYIEFGPPGSDAVELGARELFIRADAAGERVVIDPGSPSQLEVPEAVLPFLAAGIDPTTPEAMRARRPYGELPPLEAPTEVPEPFGSELRRELTLLPQVIEAWLLRAGTGWTLGVLLEPDAELVDFDEVRNRANAVASEHLGSRRELAITDLRAQPVREAYEAAAGPWYIRPPEKPKGIIGRILGG